MPDCEHYEKGNCFKDNCLYRHVKFNENTLQCEKFQKGFCPLGTNCSLRHIYKTSLNGNESKTGHIKAGKVNKKGGLDLHKDIPLQGKETENDDHTSSSANSDDKSDGTTKAPFIEDNVDRVKQCDEDQSYFNIEQTLCSESNMSQISTIQSDKDHINIQETDLFIPFTEHSSRSSSDLDYVSFSSSALRKRGRSDSDGNDDENHMDSEHEDDSHDDDDDDNDSDGSEDGSDGDGDSVENRGVDIQDGRIGEVDGMQDIDNDGLEEGENFDDNRRQDGEDIDDSKQEREGAVGLMGGSHGDERGFDDDGVDEVDVKQDNDNIILTNDQNTYEEEMDVEVKGVTTSIEYQTQLIEELRNANILQFIPRFLITQKDPFAFMKWKD
jgi:hypothetical protein